MRPRLRITSMLPMLAAAIILTGCPLLPRTNVDPSSVQIALVVEPEEIDFGTDATERTFTVRRSFSSRSMPPFQVTTSVPWLSVTPDEAISTGPDDLITITVIATRTGLEGGESTGRVTVSSENVEPKTIRVRLQQPLSANFDVSMTSPFALNPVEFTDTSRFADGIAPVTSWFWEFGDGETSDEQNPVHMYEEPGLYSVTLTVSNDTLTQTITRADLIEVREAVPPEADFTAQPTSAFVGEMVSFANFTTQGSASPIEYAWSFGDGSTSNVENPTHSYLEPGSFTVSLTATTPAGSDTLTETGLITVTTTTPPTADFSTNVATALPGQTISFRDESTPGSLPIDGWLWEFNDPNNPNDTSTSQNPSFAYAEPGTYTVSLTVTAGLDSDTITRQAAVTIDEFTALDKYVRKPDPAYGFREVGRVEQTGYTAHVLHFVSQQWRTADDIYAIGGRRTTEWEHNLIIVRPRLTPPAFPKLTGFLIISGGSNPRTTPDGVLIGLIGQAVQQSGAVVAVLEQVPNQPIQYETHIDPLREPRVEDNAIAVSYRQFLDEVPSLADPSDSEWPLLLPMVKSAVRAMDATQQFMSTQGVTVNDFVVAGASKRGWTTWLTAATDPGQRVVGIMPMVIDVLNMVPSLTHHWQVYGLWSNAIRDYERERVFDEIDTVEGALLRDIVDPWEYRGRLTMPKYVINSTGDQFFVLDSSQFYYSELLGDSRIRTIPNTDHGLSGVDQRDASAQVIFDSLPFFNSVADRRVDAMPDIEWTYDESTSVLRITPSVTPQTVRLWSGVDNLDDGAPPFSEAVGNQRNFRLDRLGPVWQSTLLNRDPDGSYSVVVDIPTQEGVWKGFFAEVRFGTGHRFTTEVFVRPTDLPFLPPNLGN
jgi:PhoPQ-activated pathogenicity-related protein/PKD repeat protein